VSECLCYNFGAHVLAWKLDMELLTAFSNWRRMWNVLLSFSFSHASAV